MRSRRSTTRFPLPILEGAIRRQKHLGYKTQGEFQTNLNRCDQIVRKDHNCTKWIAAQSQADQDFIDDCLKDFPDSVPGHQPTLSHTFCRKIVFLMTVRYKCSAGNALGYLPASVQKFCAEHGFP